MTEAVILAAILALPPTLIALAGLIASLRNSGKLGDQDVKLEEVRRHTNGMSELLQQQARAAGFESGRAAVRGGDLKPNEPESGQRGP